MPLSRLAVKPVVYVNGTPDARLQVLTIQRNLGGSRLDFAVLQADYSATQKRFMDSRLEAGQGAEIEIIATANGSPYVMFWGTISYLRATVHDQLDMHQVVARVEPYAFGSSIFGQIEVIPENQRPTVIPTARPCIFNPTYDGVLPKPNKHPKLIAFLDPYSTFTGRGRRLHGGSEPVAWQLSDVVYYLLLFGATVGRSAFRIPNIRYFRRAINDAACPVTNLELPDGINVPDALTSVLEPYGYTWSVNLESPGRRTIEVLRRGLASRVQTLRLQRPGSISDSAASNVAGIDLEVDVSSAVNAVKGIGAAPLYEGTWELVRCWPKEDDATPVAQLHKQHASFFTKRNVWRKWALNENGDYTGLRPEIKKRFDFRRAGIPPGAVGQIARRRRFLETLSKTYDGETAGSVSGCYVQHADPATKRWVQVTSQVEISDTECAVYFSGEHPPDEIMRAGANAKVRVTATIEMENPIVGWARKRPGSCLRHTNELVLDLRTQYALRHRLAAGPNISRFVADENTYADEVDDRAAIQAFCEAVRNQYDRATMSGPVEIEGLDWQRYRLGDGIAGIAGRNVNLSASTFGPIYPQIVAITYDVQGQRTILQLDEFVVERRFAQQLGAV